MNVSDNSTVDPITLILTVIGILILLGVAIIILFIFRGFLKALVKLAYFLRYVAAGVLILAIFPFSFYLFGIGVAIAANFIIHNMTFGRYTYRIYGNQNGEVYVLDSREDDAEYLYTSGNILEMYGKEITLEKRNEIIDEKLPWKKRLRHEIEMSNGAIIYITAWTIFIPAWTVLNAYIESL